MTTGKRCLLTLCGALVATAALAVRGAAAAAQSCAGDCNGDRAAGVDEIILGVRIALGDAPISECRAMDGDGDGAVAVNELLAAVTRVLQGCGAPVDDAALAAPVRAATEPILRLFDVQARTGTPGGVAGRSTASGCQQFDCVAAGQVTGTEEDCCFERQFTQVFDNCIFDAEPGRVDRLDGLFVLESDNVDVCMGAIPVGASFTASLSGLTHDVFFPDGGFARTFQDLSESFQLTPGGCAVRQPEPLGFGIRGDGLRSIDGVLQQIQIDGSGNVLVDSEVDVDALAVAVASTQGPDGCTVAARLSGSVTSADFRARTRFRILNSLHVVQPPQGGALLLELNDPVDTDCLGVVTLSTVEPLRVASGGTCFTAGRLEVPGEAATVSVTYGENGLDLDVGADGSVEEHFATCTDVPATDKCVTKVAGLCAACTAANQCRGDLSCFPCSRTCTGNTRRCSPTDTFVTCEDGVF